MAARGEELWKQGMDVAVSMKSGREAFSTTHKVVERTIID